MPRPTVPELSAPAPVDPARVARFRHGVERVLGRGVLPDDRLALAVSGGPDSMAMLALGAAAFTGQVIAATVDHGLRAEAAGEAALVADYAARIGVAHATLRIATPPDAGENVQAWGRAHRYDLLQRWAVVAGATCLATAHHADDQAETFLMRAARGSGVSGLAGIRAHQPRSDAAAIDLIRPLLDWRVTELRDLVNTYGVPFVDDPSNVDPHYDRTRFRALLQSADWLDPVQIARSAAHVAEADATLHEIEAWLWKSRRIRSEALESPDEHCWLDIVDLPRELKRRLCRTAIHAVRTANAIVRPAFDDSSNVEALLDSLEAGKTATQAGVIASVTGDIWHFAEQPPRRTG